ncbi:methyl-accepting chemotaxis protein [Paraburkholderia sartisoli]|uniref:Methyl-accepting chemotaxis protein n=1 Tax=Paraburkholderia sartisoli TaxID=83784 RepID=A0A1H4D460_9BURK|nr:methyl-accepting chemotaxis protein [Paraburkholderia sartisoli]SEA67603.1 Methyl-accepting chemotaxis protein [Paraburkholderia sartisoli]
MLKNIRIPTALTLSTAMGACGVVMVSILAGTYACLTADMLAYASAAARRVHDFPELTRIDELTHVLRLIDAGLAVSIVGGVSGAVVMRRWLGFKVVRPLDAAMRTVSAIADGQLRDPVIVNEKTQARRLFTSLAELQRELAQTVSTAKTAALAINASAGELARENFELSARTEQQAAAIQETAATTQQIAETVQRNARLAEQTSGVAADTSALIAQGSALVQQVVEAMASINNDSSRISEVVAIVDDLAFQTNILALNAAVEAARAGQEGKGFAVVAAEVRSLAQRSAGAAHEIGTLVKKAGRSVHEGARLSSEVGVTITGLVDSVQQVVTLSGEMSQSANEQNQAVRELNDVMRQIDDVTQQNARMVQSFIEATDKMGGRSNALTDAMEAWKLPLGSA